MMRGMRSMQTGDVVNPFLENFVLSMVEIGLDKFVVFLGSLHAEYFFHLDQKLSFLTQNLDRLRFQCFQERSIKFRFVVDTFRDIFLVFNL